MPYTGESMKTMEFALCLLVLCACRLALPLSTESLVFATQKQAPVTRAATRLVQVNIVVQDKKEQLITDLTRDDCYILDAAPPFQR